jgi:hypothetical protein
VICYKSHAREQEVEYVALDKLSCFEMCLTKDNCTTVSFNKKNLIINKIKNFFKTALFSVIGF